MGKLAKSLKNSIWYASKILNGTRYAEQNWEVRGTPWGEGVIASFTLLLGAGEWVQFLIVNYYTNRCQQTQTLALKNEF